MKTVLITGASGDIGQALATTFIENGYLVVGTYYSNETAILKLKENLGENFHYFQSDLSDFSQCHKLIKNIHDLGLNIDVLINNAGISKVGLLQDLDEDTWNTLWNTNVTSAVALSKFVIPDMLKKQEGKIINISSVWGNKGASCEVGYSATKGALNTFTKALSQELAPSNIQVNAISCGIIDTKMNGHLTPEDINDIIDEIPASRLGTPKDIADVVFSVANAGTYMTGQIITVDGGWQL